MCVSVVRLSRGSSLSRAVTCLIAVKNEVGLNRPGIQRLNGSVSSSDQTTSASQRRIKSANQVPRDFIEGHASFSQLAWWKGFRPGTWLIDSADERSSIFWVMFSCPARPFCSSSSVKAISLSSRFMRPHSCSTTSTYGWWADFISGSDFSVMVMRSNASGARSTRSTMSSSTRSPPDPPPPPPPARSLRMVLQINSVEPLR
mmetsp:Transcript_38809/g.52634  ORF Transcript_38809/g.52634 Transcript_38809/m.52634 type:complete len:202 (-) Transcript_38809:1787-2392(-)